MLNNECSFMLQSRPCMHIAIVGAFGEANIPTPNIMDTKESHFKGICCRTSWGLYDEFMKQLGDLGWIDEYVFWIWEKCVGIFLGGGGTWKPPKKVSVILLWWDIKYIGQKLFCIIVLWINLKLISMVTIDC